MQHYTNMFIYNNVATEVSLMGEITLINKMCMLSSFILLVFFWTPLAMSQNNQVQVMTYEIKLNQINLIYDTYFVSDRCDLVWFYQRYLETSHHISHSLIIPTVKVYLQHGQTFSPSFSTPLTSTPISLLALEYHHCATALLIINGNLYQTAVK